MLLDAQLFGVLSMFVIAYLLVRARHSGVTLLPPGETNQTARFIFEAP